MEEHFYAECHLCMISLMLSVTYKPFVLSVILLSIVMQNVIMLSVVLLSVLVPVIQLMIENA